MPVIRTIGSVEVIALEDGIGPFFKPRETVFPGATPQQWHHADAFDPGATTADGRWLLRFRCFAVRAAGRVVLVDTGIGPADSPAAGWAPVPGRLPEELAAIGIAPDDVDTVVLTHLHTDHIGWAVAAAGTPYFRNASYLLQRAEDEAVMSINPELRERLLDPLRAAQQLRLLDGVTPLATGLTVLATPGHTPGHQSVLIAAADEAILVTGDLLVHPVQLLAPELAYSMEMDPQAARESRTAQLRNLAEWPAAALATSHFGDAFTALP
ncbi:MBL fold metallo-hydrolase [Dactylosporangium sucinum]|uniref:MBL fold metallo-hydrolase n=1 Tax=Dactylosporangium sucinum TaxID=1424081 RepID=A0A917X0M0_9ACTN|nr:MBL fold metallo-hydrolase [Dactylosporangium sucinum]GGM48560.1 MBL fold metallo-hydrolase [Dactylosporangium sucinum]